MTRFVKPRSTTLELLQPHVTRRRPSLLNVLRGRELGLGSRTVSPCSSHACQPTSSPLPRLHVCMGHVSYRSCLPYLPPPPPPLPVPVLVPLAGHETRPRHPCGRTSPRIESTYGWWDGNWSPASSRPAQGSRHGHGLRSRGGLAGGGPRRRRSRTSFLSAASASMGPLVAGHEMHYSSPALGHQHAPCLSLNLSPLLTNRPLTAVCLCECLCDCLNSCCMALHGHSVSLTSTSS